MNKFGKRLVVALMAASMLATPVYAAPNTDEIQAEKEQKEKKYSLYRHSYRRWFQNFRDRRKADHQR